MLDSHSLGPGWRTARITRRRDWADGLATFTLDVSGDAFEAGQFFNLGVVHDGELVRRSYSAASAPGAPLEFFIAHVPSGSLSPGIFELHEGHELAIEPKAQGFFTLKYVPDARHLWCIATGTGLGPFLAILGSDEPWQRFERVILVHGIRSPREAAYAQHLKELQQKRPSFSVVRCVSREPMAGELSGRVTSLLESGALEAHLNAKLTPEDSHVMLCGNPQMISEVSELLKARGMRRHRQRAPGHLTTEKYW